MDIDALWTAAGAHRPAAREVLDAAVEVAVDRGGLARPSERARQSYAMAVAVRAARSGPDLAYLGPAWAAGVLRRPLQERDVRRVHEAAAARGGEVRALAAATGVDLVDVLIFDARWGPLPVDVDALEGRAAVDVEAAILLSWLVPSRDAPLRAALEAVDPADAIAAARALVSRLDGEALRDALGDPHPFVRVAACEAVAGLPVDRSQVECLLPGIEDAEELVRRRAFSAIAHHAGWVRPDLASAPLNVLALRITCLLDAVSRPARARLAELLAMDAPEAVLTPEPSELHHRRFMRVLSRDPIPVDALEALVGQDRAWIAALLLRSLHPSLARPQVVGALRTLAVDGHEAAVAEARELYPPGHPMRDAIDAA